MTRLLPSGRAGTALLLAPVLAGAVATAASADPEVLTADREHRVLTPADGELVGDGFRLAWTPAEGAASYAVVVDGRLPRPGSVVRAGSTTLLLEQTALTLTLGPRHGGSPSARRFHAVSVVPLDGDGRRIGERVALVHVRTRP